MQSSKYACRKSTFYTEQLWPTPSFGLKSYIGLFNGSLGQKVTQMQGVWLLFDILLPKAIVYTVALRTNNIMIANYNILNKF